MRLHQLTFALFGLFILCACGITLTGSDGSQVSGGITIHGYPILNSVNVTSTSSCSYGSPPFSLFGRWEVERRTGGFTSHMVYDFHLSGVTITNHCEYGGQWLHSRIDLSTTDFGNSVRLNSSADHIEYGRSMDCRVKAEAGSYRYWYSGSCLVLVDSFAGETITMVPARHFH